MFGSESNAHRFAHCVLPSHKHDFERRAFDWQAGCDRYTRDEDNAQRVDDHNLVDYHIFVLIVNRRDSSTVERNAPSARHSHRWPVISLAALYSRMDRLLLARAKIDNVLHSNR